MIIIHVSPSTWYYHYFPHYHEDHHDNHEYYPSSIIMIITYFTPRSIGTQEGLLRTPTTLERASTLTCLMTTSLVIQVMMMNMVTQMLLWICMDFPLFAHLHLFGSSYFWVASIPTYIFHSACEWRPWYSTQTYLSNNDLFVNFFVCNWNLHIFAILNIFILTTAMVMTISHLSLYHQP